MKVIVCFDQVRVTVPCGNGGIPVSELITKAVHRYRRATGRPSSHWVEVTSLKSASGGGILDTDDLLADVVDDREQLIAEFEEANHLQIQLHHNGGDATSATSSTGTISPDIFQSGDHSVATNPGLPAIHHRNSSTSSSSNNATDVVVTPRDLSLGTALRVRRGSDPGLNVLLDDQSSSKPAISIRPPITRRESVRESDDPRSESSEDEKKAKMLAYGSLDRKRFGHKFNRDATRASLSNRPDMFRWFEAREKQELSVKPMISADSANDFDQPDASEEEGQPNTCLVRLPNDGGPLGIHAVPAFDSQGQDMGLFVQRVEVGRPVHRNGHMHAGDAIVEINGTSLKNMPFQRAQEVFRAALDCKEICLRIIQNFSDVSPTSPPATRPLAPSTKKPAPPPPIMPKPRTHLPLKPSPLTIPTSPSGLSPTESDNSGSLKNFAPVSGSLVKSDDSFRLGALMRAAPLNSSSSSSSSNQTNRESSKSPSSLIKPGPLLRPPKKAAPPAIPARSRKPPAPSSHSPEGPVSLNALTNTRRIGKKINIQLRKGPLGLGFSVTSRDNQTDGNCPIYIRNILPKGAAVQDGQLRPGDRLLEVNGAEMTGKSQGEAVAFLRKLSEGSLVNLVVSRQEEVDEKFKVPREIPPHMADDMDSPPGYTKEEMTLHIPLNDTGSAGLGVSVKGKTQTLETGGAKDLGIFVKSVMQGGAAFKDGQLLVNDQLLEVNSVDLRDQSNTAAMEALRTAMMDDGQITGYITLVVARRNTPSGSMAESSTDSQAESATWLNHAHVHAHTLPSSGSHKATSIHHRSSSASDVVAHSRGPSFDSDQSLPSPIPPVRSKRVAALREMFQDAGSGSSSTSGSGLRNTSYTKATHDSLNEGNTFNNIMPNTPKPVNIKQMLSDEGKENVDTTDFDTYAKPNKPQRPHSSIGFLHSDPKTTHRSVSEDEGFRKTSTTSSKDDSDLSPSSDPSTLFSREGFGRQSMSEKRKGHLDPRNTETYRAVKANKENKGTRKSQPPPSDLWTSNMKRSSSVEDIPNPGASRPISAAAHAARNQQQQQQHQQQLQQPQQKQQQSSGRESSPSWKANRFGRARACNESFRAAVDKSYEVADPNLMDTLEEESAESGAFTLDPSFSGRSSVSSENTAEDANALKPRKGKEKEKKSGGGLLKGFLRFGKGRKSNEEAIRRSRSEERTAERGHDTRRADVSAERPKVKDRWAATSFADPSQKSELGFYPVVDQNHRYSRERRASQQEQDRIDEEYARLKEHHMAEQRLRSQSVDPSAGRIGDMSRGYQERSSPFQPYRKQHQQLQPMNSDPRLIHPAAVTHGPIPMEFESGGSDRQPPVSTYQGRSGEEVSRSSSGKSTLSRAEKIQQLRHMYQKKHKQRQGVYPLDDTEELYEQQIQQMEERWVPPNSHHSMEIGPQDLMNMQYDRQNEVPWDRPQPVRSHGSSSGMSNINSNSSSPSYRDNPPYLHNPYDPHGNAGRPTSQARSANGDMGRPYPDHYPPHMQHSNPHHHYNPNYPDHQHYPPHPDPKEGLTSFGSDNDFQFAPVSRSRHSHQPVFGDPMPSYSGTQHHYSHQRNSPSYPDPTKV